jgi:hypothetical protein
VRPHWARQRKRMRQSALHCLRLLWSE